MPRREAFLRVKSCQSGRARGLGAREAAWSCLYLASRSTTSAAAPAASADESVMPACQGGRGGGRGAAAKAPTGPTAPAAAG